MSFQLLFKGSIRQDSLSSVPTENAHTSLTAIIGSIGIVYSYGCPSVDRGHKSSSCVPSSQYIEWTLNNCLLNDKRRIQIA